MKPELDHEDFMQLKMLTQLPRDVIKNLDFADLELEEDGDATDEDEPDATAEDEAKMDDLDEVLGGNEAGNSAEGLDEPAANVAAFKAATAGEEPLDLNEDGH